MSRAAQAVAAMVREKKIQPRDIGVRSAMNDHDVLDDEQEQTESTTTDDKLNAQQPTDEGDAMSKTTKGKKKAKAAKPAKAAKKAKAPKAPKAPKPPKVRKVPTAATANQLPDKLKAVNVINHARRYTRIDFAGSGDETLSVYLMPANLDVPEGTKIRNRITDYLKEALL